jgi:hypothetical protein
MTARLLRVPGPEAYGLLYPSQLAMLPANERATIGHFMRNSIWTWIGKDDDAVLCYMGLIPPTLLSDQAYLWLRTTEAMQEHVFVFVRYSQVVIAEMLTEFPAIIGHCEVSATKSIRWLRWLGAEFGAPEDRLVPFTIRANHG